MQSIEEKLSAIKAINSEIDHCDSSIIQLSRSSLSIKSDDGLLFNHKYQVTPEVIDKIKQILMNYYEPRKRELILKAEELMK